MWERYTCTLLQDNCKYIQEEAYEKISQESERQKNHREKDFQHNWEEATDDRHRRYQKELKVAAKKEGDKEGGEKNGKKTTCSAKKEVAASHPQRRIPRHQAGLLSMR